MSVLTDIKNRGVTDTFLGLRRVEGITRCGGQCVARRDRARVHPASDPQHLPPGLKARLGRAQAGHPRPIYTAPNEAAARAAFEDLVERWGTRYPAIVRLWDNAWQEFIPFLDWPRPGDPPRAVLYERHREPERPLPARRPSSRTVPDRAGRDFTQP